MLASTPFGSSREVYGWVSGFTNLERGQILRSFRPDRMKALAELAGSPEKCAPSFHVAGSKGKGSVTGMIAAILEASKLKIARYASPHVYDFRERIACGGGFFDEVTYCRAGNELRDLVKDLPSSPCARLFDPSFPDGDPPSFFELMTLWFFLCARLSRADAMAVETGMGGRLDATNILDPLASIITNIELEHTEYLGNTIGKIAGEKAGIIKPGRPVFIAEQDREALTVLKERAEANESPVFYFPECTELRNIRFDQKGTTFDLFLKKNVAQKDTAQGELLSGILVKIPGEVQAYNAGLAILAVKTVFPHITETDIRKGLACFTLPARFERISGKPLIIADGAHTPRSVEYCLKTFSSLYGDRGILVFGCAEGKDLLSMAKLCVPSFSRIIITTPGTFKKSNPEKIYEAFSEEAEKLKESNDAMEPKAGQAPRPIPEILFFPETAMAIKKALEPAIESGVPFLGTGSFYLAAEIRKIVETSDISRFRNGN